ncbi:thioredoxin-dependent thiol peroxidase [Candidatus Peribacteria bacterium]|nr:MAG: thioredoxin-dependent thiol peroxidase [Candidatus Peribacteria bacterium]
MIPAAGTKAPDFSLPDQNGEMHRLSDFHGQWIVLYFYPKDDTPGCTTEACAFRDSVHELTKRKVSVIGVSTDSVASHKKFADKYELPFLLLADTEKTVVEAYGVWGPKKMYGKEYMGILRTTFLIDPTGTIINVYENVQPDGHASQILADRDAA